MDKKKPVFAYVSSGNPTDKKAWSGTLNSIYECLKSELGDVDVLGPHEPFWPIFFGKLKTFFFQLFGKRYNYRHSKSLSRAYAVYFEKRLGQKKYDYIITPAGSCEIAYLNTTVPIIYISDTTLKLSVNYHKALSHLSSSSLKESLDTEKRALEKSKYIIVSSEWAADSVLKDFSIPREKVSVWPLGANFTEVPDSEFVFKNRKKNIDCNLVFIGVNWESKGGPIACNVLSELNKRHINATLTVVGCNVPDEFKKENITNIPFIYKDTEEGKKQFISLLLNSDFLIFPTRYEAFGIVCCEASAFGVISVASNTGGVGGAVKEGVNGFLVDSADGGKGYADKIIELLNNPAYCDEVRRSARKLYEGKLNWISWAENLKKILEIK